MKHIYNENESESDSMMESNRESYGDVFGNKKKPGINPSNKMSNTGGAGMYNLANVKSSNLELIALNLNNIKY